MSLTSNHEARTIEGYRSVTRAIADEATFAKTQLDKLNVKAVDDSYNRLGRHPSPALKRRVLDAPDIHRYPTAVLAGAVVPLTPEATLGKLCHLPYHSEMTTMNVSLPDDLKTFVDTQVSNGGYGSTSEYVRDLIRRAQDRERLRSAILEGASSPIASTADDYLDTLRARIPHS